MVLDMPGGIFPKVGLYQEDGLINEKWNQPGSTVKNIKVAISSSATQYTVTAGKTLYIKEIIISEINTNVRDGFDITDNGTDKFEYRYLAVDTQDQITLNVPLQFNTSIDSVESGAILSNVTFLGWEE